LFGNACIKGKTPLSEQPPTADAPPPLGSSPALPDPIVEREIPCRNCGYLLRGLTQSSQCPECHTPVELSLAPDLLLYADPFWLKRIHTGVRLFLGAQLLLLAYAVTLTIQRIIWRYESFMVYSFANNAIQLLQIVFVALMWWSIQKSTPAGAHLQSPEPYFPRKAARLFSTTWLIFYYMTILYQWADHPRTAATLNVLNLATGALMFLSIYGTYARLARRIPNERLARRSQFLGRSRFFLAIAMATLYAMLFLKVLSAVLGALIVLPIALAAIILWCLELHFLWRFAPALFAEGVKTVHTQHADAGPLPPDPPLPNAHA
jgi:hypothetical protein